MKNLLVKVVDANVIKLVESLNKLINSIFCWKKIFLVFIVFLVQRNGGLW